MVRSMITVQPGAVLYCCPACGMPWGGEQIPAVRLSGGWHGRTTCCDANVVINGFVFPRLVRRDAAWR